MHSKRPLQYYQSTSRKSEPGSIYQTVKHVRNVLQIREALGNTYGLFDQGRIMVDIGWLFGMKS